MPGKISENYRKGVEGAASHMGRTPTPLPCHWRWLVFGTDTMHLVIMQVPVPWWRRLITRVLLGSSWERGELR